jgi:oligoribonuclease (3'-5' exoribonuclease)
MKKDITCMQVDDSGIIEICRRKCPHTTKKENSQRKVVIKKQKDDLITMTGWKRQHNRRGGH